MMRTAPHTKYAFHLYSDVLALCSHMYLFRCIRHSMNHREQFSLSVVTTLRQFSDSVHYVVPCLLVLFRKDGFPSDSINTTL